MGKKHHTTEQIVEILQSAEKSEVSIEEFCRSRGVSVQSFYRWKKNYGGMQVNEAKRLKELERENARLKKLLAERDVEIDVMKEINAKKW